MTKTERILKVSSNVAASDAVKALAAEGIKVSPQYVRKVRARHQGKAQPAAAKPAFGAKADFIRSMPDTMPAKDVVAEAAKQGLKLTESHVYNLRSTKKHRSGRRPGRPRKEPHTKVILATDYPPLRKAEPSFGASSLNEFQSALNALIDARVRLAIVDEMRRLFGVR